MGEIRRAAGYLLILAPPALLALSVSLDTPWLAFVALIGVLPFMRPLFGDSERREPDWSERIATLLDGLPLVYAALAPLAVGHLLANWSAVAENPVALVWWGLSLWATFLFASCVAHELVHRRSPRPRGVGRVLSGMIGYPLLEHEHRTHHGTSGNVDAAEWPRLDENVWQFTGRRLGRVFQSAWDSDHVASVRAGHRLAGGLPLALLSFVMTAVAFTLAGGLAGLSLFAIVAAAMAWSMQAITYVQHWGLGTDNVTDAGEGDYGWEDRCQLQAWLTLSISYHQAHHRASAVPYYRQMASDDAPRMPAGYVVLLFASLVPPLWRRWLTPALEQWKTAPANQRGCGRRLFCIAR